MAALNEYHRFLDEAGDSTFYGKSRLPIIGQPGVSHCFILGMVAFKSPLDEIRAAIIKHQTEIGENEIFQKVPSVQKRLIRGGFYFHAKDDLPVWHQARNALSSMLRRAAHSLEASDRASSHRACNYCFPDARLPRPVRQLPISFPHDALGGDVFWSGLPSSTTRKEFVAVK